MDATSSARAMSKFLKEAKRVKQVLSANTETISQVYFPRKKRLFKRFVGVFQKQICI